jgi:hypothetical protein
VLQETGCHTRCAEEGPSCTGGSWREGCKDSHEHSRRCIQQGRNFVQPASLPQEVITDLHVEVKDGKKFRVWGVAQISDRV